ncbi:MAG: ATP phosphoribosyltransferase regulatory subunit, partial [Pseudomonadota bacterium]
MTQPLWMLPQGIEEILPPVAARIEAMRRRILDLHTRWGYELVYPPIVEHLESLLTGTGHALDMQTFKLIDPLSGRSLGVHADMTPQVARIDASRLRRDGTVRLSYAGTVLRTQRGSVGEGRSPMQLGAELFGHQGVESDAEIVSLMLASLAEAGVDTPQLDLGHVGVYRALVQPLDLDPADETQLFDIMLRKARPELDGLVGRLGLGDTLADALRRLLGLAGDQRVLDRAHDDLASGGAPVVAALAELRSLVCHI